MIITHEQLEQMLPDASDATVMKFFMPLNETLERFNIVTKLRIACFIAQVGHESGSFRYMQELASGQAYNNRKDLGNLETDAVNIAKANHTTVGQWFKGHGPIQITGFYNHKRLSEFFGEDFLNHPELLCTPHWGMLSAGWFWDIHKLNNFADLGKFLTITKRINGGTNGLDDRVRRFKNCLAVYNVPFQQSFLS